LSILEHIATERYVSCRYKDETVNGLMQFQYQTQFSLSSRT